MSCSSPGGKAIGVTRNNFIHGWLNMKRMCVLSREQPGYEFADL